MSRDRGLRATQASAAIAQGHSRARRESSQLLLEERPNRSEPIFRAAWYAWNALLFVSILLATNSADSEYSNRRYLNGF